MIEVFVACACTAILGIAAWIILLGNRVTHLEANDKNRDGVMADVKAGVNTMNTKLDAFILAMVHPPERS